MTENKKAALPSRAATQEITASIHPVKEANLNHNINLPLVENQSSTTLGSSATAQRSKILIYLQTGPLTLLQGQGELGILRLAARNYELRTEGYRIKTGFVEDVTPKCNPQRVAKYVLSMNIQLPLFDLQGLGEVRP